MSVVGSAAGRRFPHERPSFTQIVGRVTEMYLNANRAAAERLSKVQEDSERGSNVFSVERTTNTTADTSTEYGSSRPASPGTLQQLDTAASAGMSDATSF